MAEVWKYDLLLFHLLNGLSGQQVVSYGAFFLQGTNLGALLMMAAFWWFWFKDSRHHRLIVAMLIAAVASLIISRLLSALMPFSVRPMYTSDIGYQVPNLPEKTRGAFGLETWSSFPSNHIALHFALSYGLWLLSRIGGTAAFCFSLLTGVARIVLGIHCPSDIIVGALIGIGTAAASYRLMDSVWVNGFIAVKERSPHVFYSVMFVVTSETYMMYYDIRLIAHGIRHVLHDFGYRSLGLFAAMAIGAAGLLALAVLTVWATWIIGRLRKSDRTAKASSREEDRRPAHTASD